MVEPVSAFISPEGLSRYREAYAETLRLWPVQFVTMNIPTRFGSTHIIRSGPEGAPALLLLHGFGFSSTMWYPNVGALSSEYRTYAVDIAGDLNLSVASTPLRSLADYTDWLAQVLDGLHLAQAVLVGHAFGGWLAAGFANRHPERVAQLVLLAPAAALLPIKNEFWLRSSLAQTVGTRAAIASFARWFVTEETWRQLSHEPDLVNQTVVGWKYFRWAKSGIRPSVFTDAEWQEIRVPTLLLVGEKEVIYDPRAAVQRAGQLLPDLEARVVPNAGHLLTLDQPDETNRRILAFLAVHATVATM